MSDKMRDALEEVCRVLESNDSAIVDTIWVSTGQPETLLDHCKAALEVSEPAQVSQPVGFAIFRAAQTLTTDGYCDGHEWLEFCDDGCVGDDGEKAFQVYKGLPDYEALKENTKLLDDMLSKVIEERNNAEQSMCKLKAENEALKWKYEGALESIRDRAKLGRVLLAENEALKLRVAELESESRTKHEYAMQMLVECDRLQSECDRLKEELNAWKIGFGSKAK